MLIAATMGAATAVCAAPTDLRVDMQTLLREEGLVGAAYAIVDGPRIQLDAVGQANALTAQPLSPEARVHVGSVAKTLISLAVLRLATQGRVDLDAPVQTLLPALALRNPWQASDPLRLRHLLDHTGGLEDMRLWHLLNRQHRADMPLAEAFAIDPALLNVRTAPGTTMSYSNLGYTLAGMVIEALTGERYEDWGRRELLRPLGMNDSAFEFRTQTGPHADPRLAWGHLDSQRPWPAMAVAARPGAQFTTTAGDMARLARFLMGDGRLDGTSFVNHSLLQRMGRPQDTDAARAGLSGGYALGLARRDRHGAIGYCHEGSVVGCRAMLCLFPDQDRAFFVAFNTDSETASYARLYERLVQALGVAAAPPAANPAPTTPAANDWNGTYALAPSRFETFALFDLLVDTRRWTVDGTGATWDRRAGSVEAAANGAALLFRPADRVQATHVLTRSDDGHWRISEGLKTFERIPTLLPWAARTSVAAGALGLLYWLLAPAWRRRRAALLQPGTVAALSLLAAVAVMALHPWTALGELTAGTGALFAATAALVPLMLWQAARAWRAGRAAAVARRMDLVAALAVLQAVALLAWWGLVPLALWR